MPTPVVAATDPCSTVPVNMPLRGKICLNWIFDWSRAFADKLPAQADVAERFTKKTGVRLPMSNISFYQYQNQNMFVFGWYVYVPKYHLDDNVVIYDIIPAGSDRPEASCSLRNKTTAESVQQAVEDIAHAKVAPAGIVLASRLHMKNLYYYEPTQVGDSVWAIFKRNLAERFESHFTDASAASQDQLIDTLKDEVAEHPQAYGEGVKNADLIYPVHILYTDRLLGGGVDCFWTVLMADGRKFFVDREGEVIEVTTSAS